MLKLIKNIKLHCPIFPRESLPSIVLRSLPEAVEFPLKKNMYAGRERNTSIRNMNDRNFRNWK